MLLLIGPAVAVIGIVAVVFVMRHKSVEKRSMYSARRSQIEHKVRAARQRTLAPTRRAEKADKGRAIEETASAAPVMTYEATAYASPPVAPPPAKAPSQSAWDSGPVTTPVDTPAYSPPAPAYEPQPATPAYEPTPAPPTPPAYEPTPPQPAYEPTPPAYEPPPYTAPSAQPEWTPSPPTPIEPERPVAVPASTSAGAGATWSVVGESKASADSEPAAKKKGSKDAQSGTWSLASGEAAGDEPDEGPKKPSAVIAIAQYAVLVVGLVMVLIGVVVMVANSHGS
ncbi:MAG TPA: hypothetical protein VNU19_06095 [Candidatus Acidoferrum sp.]|jgi:hypothetical protein|nr:hypothetical protein [Candidatus Acidoferrum sp.]